MLQENSSKIRLDVQLLSTIPPNSVRLVVLISSFTDFFFPNQQSGADRKLLKIFSFKGDLPPNLFQD